MDTTWNADVLSKEFVDGMLTVTVRFTKDDAVVQEQYQTNQGQDDNWLNDAVARKIASLNAVAKLHDTIDNGPVIPTATLDEEQLSKDKQDYVDHLKVFQQYVVAISRGFTTTETDHFVELKNYLTENFKPEYLDLFGV